MSDTIQNPTGNDSKESHTEAATTPETKQPTQSNTRDDLDAVIAKARADEKKKVFSKLEAIQAEKEELEKRQSELAKDLKDTKQQLDGIREGKMTELKSVNEELASLRERNLKLEKAVEEVASSAAQRILQSELNAYRESKLRDARIDLVELVTGSTKEEIDASIQAAVARESALREKAREDVRKEMAASLPAPIAPDGSQGRGPSGPMGVESRVHTAKLRGDDYTKARQQLLEEARQKAGL